MVIETTIAHSPTAIDTRPPQSTRAIVSRPRSSVPSGCLAENVLEAEKSMSLMGVRQASGPTMVTRTIAR
jgi:hypothetical protein